MTIFYALLNCKDDKMNDNLIQIKTLYNGLKTVDNSIKIWELKSKIVEIQLKLDSMQHYAIKFNEIKTDKDRLEFLVVEIALDVAHKLEYTVGLLNNGAISKDNQKDLYIDIKTDILNSIKHATTCVIDTIDNTLACSDEDALLLLNSLRD